MPSRRFRRAPIFRPGPCAKPPGWSPQKLDTRSARPLAPRRAGQAAPRLLHRPDARDARASRQPPHRHRPRLRHRRVRAGDVVDARATAGDLPRVGKLRRRLGHRRGQAIEARPDRPPRRLWRAARPWRSRLVERRPVHLERHHQRGPRSRRRVDRRRTARACHFADATSAVFAYDIPWDKIDVATFSWQKALGGEGGHGVLVLGPRAVERLERFTPDRPLPKLFRLTKSGKLIEGVFRGETINTPSMLAVEDAIFALEWAQGRRRPQGPDRAHRRQCRRARPHRRGARLADLSRRATRRAARRPASACSVAGADCGRSSRQFAGAARGRRRGVRHRRLSRRPAGPPHLVRGDRRHRRHRSARAVARLGMEGIAGMITTIIALAAAAQAPQGARQQANVVMPEDAGSGSFSRNMAMPMRSSATASSICPVFLPISRPAKPTSTRRSRAPSKPGQDARSRRRDLGRRGPGEQRPHRRQRPDRRDGEGQEPLHDGQAPAWTAVGTNGLLQPGGSPRSPSSPTSPRRQMTRVLIADKMDPRAAACFASAESRSTRSPA